MGIGVVIRKKQSKVISDKYDMEVEEHHNYFANGICVHNSVGKDITDNVLFIESVPTELEFDGDLTLRGEFYLPKAELEKLLRGKKISDSSILNERNICAGAINSKNPKDTASKNIKFIVYRAWINGKEIKDLMTAFNQVNGAPGNHFGIECKFEFVPQMLVDNPAYFKDVVPFMMEERERVPFRTDGIVIQINRKDIRDSFGFNRYNPKGAIAFKFQTEQAVTRLTGITWSTSKFGTINPVANLSPVVLCDTVVKAATLHNIDFIEQMGLSIGDDIVLEKSGDIIPHVIRAIHRNASDNVNYPKFCPSCGYTTSRDGAMIICTNPYCKSVMAGSVSNYLQSIGIEEPGEVMVQQMVDSGMVKSIEDIYKLDVNEVEKLDRCSKMLAERYIDNIKNVKTVPLVKFLCGLPIRDIGEKTWSDVCNEFKTLDGVISANVEKLKKVKNIADITAQKIESGIFNNIRTIESLRNLISVQDVGDKKGCFCGVSFCFTGTLSHPRKEFEKIVTDNGGELKSVTRTLNYLVCGQDGGSKLEKARKFGVPVIDEKHFMMLIK